MNFSDGIVKNTEFFTTAELAEKLKMNVQVVTRKVQAGEIRAYKIGKEWRIPEQSVHEWLQQKMNVAAPAVQEAMVRHTIEQPRTNGKPLSEESAQRKRFLLEYILAQFEPHRLYSEDELNRIILRHHHDNIAIRQLFLTEQMMDERDGFYCRRMGYSLTRRTA